MAPPELDPLKIDAAAAKAVVATGDPAVTLADPRLEDIYGRVWRDIAAGRLRELLQRRLRHALAAYVGSAGQRPASPDMDVLAWENGLIRAMAAIVTPNAALRAADFGGLGWIEAVARQAADRAARDLYETTHAERSGVSVRDQVLDTEEAQRALHGAVAFIRRTIERDQAVRADLGVASMTPGEIQAVIASDVGYARAWRTLRAMLDDARLRDALNDLSSTGDPSAPPARAGVDDMSDWQFLHWCKHSAGVPETDMAECCGVARTTVQAWLKGSSAKLELPKDARKGLTRAARNLAAEHRKRLEAIEKGIGK